MTEAASAATAAPTGGPVLERLRLYGRGSRIVGVDVARGLAVLGMFGAHVGLTQSFDWRPETWSGVVHGRSAVLFALLAGVSLAILSGRTRRQSGNELQRTGLRIATRALIILGIGAALELLGTNVAVILTYYGVLFLLALPFLRVPPGWLFAIAGALAIVMPVLVYVPRSLASGDEVSNLGDLAVSLLVTGNYPALVWLAFVLAGMGIGRLELANFRVQAWLLASGCVLAAAGYGLGEWARSTVPGVAVTGPNNAASPFGYDWRGILTTEPHSGSPFEVVGSTGFAIAILALCLLASRGIRWSLYPLAAVGSMALTAYTVQVVAIAVFDVDVPGRNDNLTWLAFSLVTVVLCSVWGMLVGKGPLEAVLRWLSRRVARQE